MSFPFNKSGLLVACTAAAGYVVWKVKSSRNAYPEDEDMPWAQAYDDGIVLSDDSEDAEEVAGDVGSKPSKS